MLAPAGTTVIVIIFTIVILIKRQDLRNRVLRLLGRGRMPRATQAFDDAAERVTRYLRMQFLVNTWFGAMIAVGLYAIGLPSALLWGALAGLLRFMPYLGPILEARCRRWWPCGVSRLAATADAWDLPGDRWCGIAIEPWLHGAHTGKIFKRSGFGGVLTTLWGRWDWVLPRFTSARCGPPRSATGIPIRDPGRRACTAPEARLYQRRWRWISQGAGHGGIRPPRNGAGGYDGSVPALRLAKDRHRGARRRSRSSSCRA